MKKTLIIIPGWGGTQENWQSFIDLAKKDYQVVFLSLPCFGDKPCPSEIWGVDEYVDFVKNKIQDLNITKPILFAHSFGGQIASKLVVENPNLIDKLILSGAAIIRPSHTTKRIIFGIIAKIGQIIFKLPILNRFNSLAKKILYCVADSPDYNQTNGIKRKIFQKVIRENLEYLLPKIKKETLVVWGEYDKYVSLKIGKKIAQLIPNSKLKIISQGKHGLHINCPERLLKEVNNFINNK